MRSEGFVPSQRGRSYIARTNDKLIDHASMTEQDKEIAGISGAK